MCPYVLVKSLTPKDTTKIESDQIWIENISEVIIFCIT